MMGIDLRRGNTYIPPFCHEPPFISVLPPRPAPMARCCSLLPPRCLTDRSLCCAVLCCAVLCCAVLVRGCVEHHQVVAGLEVIARRKVRGCDGGVDVPRQLFQCVHATLARQTSGSPHRIFTCS
jgi:hypothetical protein